MSQPDDCGVEPTNQPGLSVLWERHGQTVRVAFVPAPEPEPDPGGQFSVPRGE